MEVPVVLTDSMHAFSQACLIPIIVVLALLIVVALFNVGAVLVEYLTERRLMRAKIPLLLDRIDECSAAQLPSVIEDSQLLRRQRRALAELLRHAALPIDSQVALAKRLIGAEDERYRRVVSRTDMVAKVAPMVGLMGTLIPLGPGILALSTGDTATLSSALLIAFDTTVMGLVAAAIALVVSKVRSLWYEGYMASLEAVATALLKRLSDMDAAGRRTLLQAVCATDVRVAAEGSSAAPCDGEPAALGA